MMLLICLLSLFCPAYAGNVLQLKDSNFQSESTQHNLLMVKFFAPWCGHCKKLAPEYEKAADQLMKLDPPVYLAEVDCTTEKNVCEEAGVSGYPTLMVYRNGKDPKPYDGARSSGAIYEYMKMHSLPAIIEITSKDDFLSKVDDHKPTVVSYIQSKEDPLFKIIDEVASDLRGKLVFMYTLDASVMGVAAERSRLRLHRPKFLNTKLEVSTVNFAGESTVSHVKEWIMRNGYGLVGYRTDNNEAFFPRNALLTLYHNATAEDHLKGVIYFKNRMIKYIREANAVQSGLIFAYCPLETCQGEVNQFGFTGDEGLPFVGIISGGKKFRMENFSRDAFVDFLQKYMNGELTPYLKTQPIPDSQPDNVQRVVAANFDEIVNDRTKDVFVGFVAPWCGHCQALKPKFESAAGKLKNEPSIIFASMDATENDVPSLYTVTGFPTLYYVPKENKEKPIKYQGGREEEDFIKYVAKMSTDGLVGYDREGKLKKTEL